MSATFAQIETSFPDEEQKRPAGSNGYGSGESNQSKSPLHGFSFFKSFTSDKKVKADGQPPKRRGPKPDSKPALTRRQELNRQAQRTHRERKEMYIKALEQEVLSLKETFANTCRERDAVSQENLKLKEILAHHGIALPSGMQDVSSSGSFSGSYPLPSSTSNKSPVPVNAGQQQQQQQQPLANNDMQPTSVGASQLPAAGNLNYDQIGIDFVLAVERPCMDHMQMLCVKSQTSEGDISGHALMTTCPPQSHLIERPDVEYPHQAPDMQAGDLLKLLDLSNRLPLDGEVTPVMAWAAILKHEDCGYLHAPDFAYIKNELLGKVRCYGFGAVLEEFEIEDSIKGALFRKNENRLAGN